MLKSVITKTFFANLLFFLWKNRNNKNKGALKVLIYHNLPEEKFDKFKTQMEFIQKYYGFINPGDIEGVLNGRIKFSGTKVLLTFDDGFRSNAILAKKILDPLAIKAIFFVPTGFIACGSREQQTVFIARNIFDGRLRQEDVEESMAPLSWPDLFHLKEQGHTIGAHTINHRRLTETGDPVQLESEIAGSGEELGKVLGENIDHFSFPFGSIESIDIESMKIIIKHFKFCYSGVRGNNFAFANRHAILRDPINVDDSLAYLRFIIEDGLRVFYQKRALDLQLLVGGFSPPPYKQGL